MRVPVIAVATAVVLGSAACGTAGTADDPAVPDASECAQIAAIAPPPGAPLMSFVVDHTASGDGTTLGPGAAALLTAAQRAGAVLDVSAVDGAGAAPRAILRGFTLDPLPGVDSGQADRARETALACVPILAGAMAATPTRAGSDVLGAVVAEAVKRPRWLLVSSDGVATAGALVLDQATYGQDPAATADTLADHGQLTSELSDTQVLWNGIGQTDQALPRPVLASLARLWTAVLVRMGARPDAITIDQRPGVPTAQDDGALPADPIDVPAITAANSPGGRTFAVPDALLFAPGDTRLAPDAEDVLSPLARDIAGAARPVVVVGHAADYGEPAYQQYISAARADAVATRLVSGGVAPALVSTRGAGATEPAIPEWHDGRHDETAAAMNRRVTITVLGR